MIRYFLLNIATWNIFFLRLKAGSSPTPPDITSGPKMASFPSTSFFCVWKSNTSPSWTLWMYMCSYLVNQLSYLVNELAKPAISIYYLDNLSEKCPKNGFPQEREGGNGLPQKMIKLCYILHIFALCTLFLFLLFCPIGERKIYIHPFMDKLFAKEVKTAFGIPPPPFGEESAKKNLTDFLWFAEKDKRISKHFVQSSFRRHWFLTLVAILPISVTTLSTSEFNFSAIC